MKDNIRESDPPTTTIRHFHTDLYITYLARSCDLWNLDKRIFFPFFDFIREMNIQEIDINLALHLRDSLDQMSINQLNPYVPLVVALQTGVKFRMELSSAIVIDENARIVIREFKDDILRGFPRDIVSKNNWIWFT